MPIFDQGYQHWQGSLSGHAWRWLAVTRHGIRAQFRGRWTTYLVLVAWAPALALAALLSLWGLFEQKSSLIAPILELLRNLPQPILADPILYRKAIWAIAYYWFLRIELFVAMLLVLSVGPGLISQDLRFNAMPLYFSRPLSRFDYFLGKLGVIGVYLGAVAIVPAVIAWVLGVAFSLDFSIIKDTFRILVGSVVYGLTVVVSAGTLMLALSSLTRNARYVGAMWIGIWIISSMLAGAFAIPMRERQNRLIAEAYQAEMQAQVQSGRPVTPEGLLAIQERLEEEREREWWPLLSYTENLERICRALLGTDAAWEQIGDLAASAQRQAQTALQAGGRGPPFVGRRPPASPAVSRARIMTNFAGPNYPWTWSAAVLLGLFGLSVWILKTRVKSLDRLR